MSAGYDLATLLNQFFRARSDERLGRGCLVLVDRIDRNSWHRKASSRCWRLLSTLGAVAVLVCQVFGQTVVRRPIPDGHGQSRMRERLLETGGGDRSAARRATLRGRHIIRSRSSLRGPCCSPPASHVGASSLTTPLAQTVPDRTTAPRPS
jgi:hypothetical protein